MIQAGTNRRWELKVWGKEATEEELQRAAEDLLSESDDGRLLMYVNIFRDRRFPGPPERLLNLVRTASRVVAYAAAAALVHVGGAEVRATALGLLAQPDKLGVATKLLAASSAPADYRILESLLERSLTDDQYHSLGISVLAFVRTDLRQEAARSLILLYEKGPCSMCRSRAVRQLQSLGCVPDWMREECRYDAVADTRKAVTGAEADA